MQLDLNTLEIQLLFKCNIALISKTKFARILKNYSKLDKEKAISHLISKNLVNTQALPKQNSKRVPVFYQITETGKKWLENYNKNYPK